MDGGDRLHRIILREYRNNQLLNEASWAQKAVDESRVPQPGPDELDKIMEKLNMAMKNRRRADMRYKGVIFVV